MNTREFGVRVTQLRERQQLSITKLAALLGVDYMQVSRYEKGQSLPSLDTAARLAQALKVSLDELVSGSEPPEESRLPVFRNTGLFERACASSMRSRPSARSSPSASSTPSSRATSSKILASGSCAGRAGPAPVGRGQSFGRRGRWGQSFALRVPPAPKREEKL